VGSTEVRLFNRIAVLRAERSLNYQTIGYIERGDYFPSLDLAFKLSELFGVPIEMIFSRQPFEPMSTAQLRLNGNLTGKGVS
jgi:DNA-binding XRE family transcriptional regulator